MKGKVLFVAGLATGYVLGTRAGRKRYEQIRAGWEKVWNTAPVQKQVSNLEDFAKARISEVPQALLNGVKKAAGALASDATPGEKLDETISAAKTTAEDLDAAADGGKQNSGDKPNSGSKPSSSSRK